MRLKTLTLLWIVTSLAFVRGAQIKTENIILVTVDGVRWQEFFSGCDKSLLDQKKHDLLLSQLEAPSAEDRREALMPFFWKELVPNGIVLGNRELNSHAKIKNPHRFSYPGYAEILLGRVIPEIDSNDKKYNPQETVLEFVRRKLNLNPAQVATFTSWDVFKYICVRTEGSVYVNAGRERVPERYTSPTVDLLNQLQFEALTPWDSVRHDSFTADMAIEYLKEQHPKFLFVALDETDDWAHDGRYDRHLQSLRFLDSFLEKLWTHLQAIAQYRDRTTLFLTTDHGRGNTASDWTDHGDVAGAENVWLAVIGPDTPAKGVLANVETVYHSSIAASILRFIGLDFQEFSADAEPPIELVFKTLD